MYCKKCGKQTDGDDYCKECAPQQGKVTRGLGLSIVGFVLGLAGIALSAVAADFVIAALNENMSEFLLYAAICAAVGFVSELVALVFACVSISRFKRAVNKGNRPPVPALVLGILDLPNAVNTLVLTFAVGLVTVAAML